MTTNPAPGFIKHLGHRVAITKANVKVTVEIQGTQIAASSNALLVDESRHDQVYYIPRSDVETDHLIATDHSSYCPFKGHARYWTIKVGDRSEENAVWAYDEPYDEALPLKGHVAFYPDRVDSLTTSPITTSDN